MMCEFSNYGSQEAYDRDNEINKITLDPWLPPLGGSPIASQIGLPSHQAVVLQLGFTPTNKRTQVANFPGYKD